MCETPGICTYFWLLRRPAARLMSKNAHPCSPDHRLTHLVSKTAHPCSRNHRLTHLVSKTAHPCSRNHRLPHLVSKTAHPCSRTQRSPFAANDIWRFRRYSLPLHRLQGSPLKARDSGPAGGVRFRVNLGDNCVAVWHGVVFWGASPRVARRSRPQKRLFMRMRWAWPQFRPQERLFMRTRWV